MKRTYIYSLLFSILLAACVSDFNANIPLSGTNVLVVEGHIVGNSTIEFYFSKSFGLEEDAPPEGYDDVQVQLYLIGDDGSRSRPAVYEGHGIHKLEIGELNPNVAYGIEFEYDGDKYQSKLSKALYTPQIDDLNWIQPEEYGDVTFRLSTQDPNREGHAYFLWEYSEDWEVVARYSTTIFYDWKSESFYIDNTAPLTYCWNNAINKNPIVGTTENLIEKKIVNKKIFSQNSANSRFSYLYAVQVTQQSISKAAYEYYLDKIKSNSEMGGLFTPQPSEIEGNITCISDSDKKVIGFIDVTHNITSFKKFITLGEISKKPVIVECNDIDFMAMPSPDTFYQLYMDGLRPVSYATDPVIWGNRWVSIKCADCTYQGATKNKPLFWPNDHQ